MLSLPLPDLWLLNVVLAALAIAGAVWLRPWRALHAQGPPWAWVGVCSFMPLLWGLDHYSRMPLVMPLSLAPMMVLLCGWPLAVLALVPVAASTALTTGIDPVETLNRFVWLGVVPATAALAVGAATRRWLPRHLFVYILGRAWLGTFAACLGAGGLAAVFHDAPQGVASADRWIATLMNAFGEAFLTGTLIAGMVCYRPQWLATYTDRLYLPAGPRP